MEKLYKLALCVCFTLFTASAGFSQTVNVDVTAEVLAQINLTKNADVVFGEVPPNGSPVIDANSTNDQDLAGSFNFGKITVDAATNQSILITWNSSTTLTRASASTNPITFTAGVTGSSGEDDAANSTDITSGSTQTTGSSASTNPGFYYIYVGGNLGTLNAQPAGSYSSANPGASGAITFTVTYN